jgi:hypothetical protein
MNVTPVLFNETDSQSTIGRVHMVTMTEVPAGRRTSLLSGVTVLDLTRFLAGPFGTMVLADMGATVIKVEQLIGDTTRYQAPYHFESDSAYFLATNRNKQSITLNIRSEGGRRVLERLIARSDIMIDNLRAIAAETAVELGTRRKDQPVHHQLLAGWLRARRGTGRDGRPAAHAPVRHDRGAAGLGVGGTAGVGEAGTLGVPVVIASRMRCGRSACRSGTAPCRWGSSAT